MRRAALGALVLCLPQPACTDDGAAKSNVQFDFSKQMPAQVTPGTTPNAKQLPADAHLTFYAIQHGADADRLFAVTTFEIHHIVDLQSPCFIDVGEHVPHPGLHVSQFAKVIGEDTGITDIANPPPGASEQDQIDAATAVQRELDIDKLVGAGGIVAVTSPSPAVYPAVAADCDATDGIPPPDCTDEASNARRLALCEAAWHADPNLFEGTDRVLTTPLSGITHGMVDGMNPINLAPVGGAQFFTDTLLDGIDAYAVYWQLDGAPDPSAASPLGTLLLFGEPTTPTRGVVHVHMESPAIDGLTAEVAIFPNLEDDDVDF